MGQSNDAEGILAQVKNLAFFKLPDHDSAEWASLRCGEGRRIDPMQECTKVERRFPYTEFNDLYKFQEHVGLPGIFRTGDRYPTRATIMPLLLEKLHQVPEEFAPLGHIPWPGDAIPKPNADLERVLGSRLTMPPQPMSGRIPTTGRILPPTNQSEN